MADMQNLPVLPVLRCVRQAPQASEKAFHLLTQARVLAAVKMIWVQVLKPCSARTFYASLQMHAQENLQQIDVHPKNQALHARIVCA